jgi:hypothetical protein
MCQGTTFAWCSMCDSTIASPAPRLARAQVYATRLIASVALRVNTTSSDRRALMKRATLRRASSNAAVASSAMEYTPRWMFA